MGTDPSRTLGNSELRIWNISLVHSEMNQLQPHMFTQLKDSELDTHLSSCPHYIHQLESWHFSIAANSDISSNQNVLSLCKASSVILTACEQEFFIWGLCTTGNLWMGFRGSLNPLKLYGKHACSYIYVFLKVFGSHQSLKGICEQKSD